MGENVRATKRGWNFDPVTNSLDLIVDGRILTKFAGDYPNIYEVDSTQKYELGTRLQTTDGRVFRYASTTTGGVKSGWGAFATAALPMAYEALHANAAAGQNYVLVNQASIAADDWAGGYIIMGNSDSTYTQNRRIVSNTATDGDTHVYVYLDAPLTVALTTSYGFEIMPNPYKSISVSANEYSGVVGVPAATAATDKYVWIQTWGPCWIVPGGTGTPGSTAMERTLYFVGDGSVNGDVGLVDPTTEPERRQVAGFILQRDSAGAGGPPFVMLQISP
jgi:hypothetical protein